MTIRLLSALAICCALYFGLRFSEMSSRPPVSVDTAALGAAGLEGIEPSAGDTPAEATGKTAPPSQAALEKSSGTPPLPEAPRGDAPSEKIETPAKATEGKATDAKAKPGDKNWRGAEDLDDDYADVKMELFEDLSKRRKDLDVKEKDLAMREALLKATQSEIEQKTKELTTLKTDIEALLKKQTEQEDKRIASLVKIYEGMKAKDAARIFDTLDQDVLMQVVTKMSERKTAPILAAMNADKARNLTIMLAEQNKLPSSPNLTAQ